MSSYAMHCIAALPRQAPIKEQRRHGLHRLCSFVDHEALRCLCAIVACVFVYCRCRFLLLRSCVRLLGYLSIVVKLSVVFAKLCSIAWVFVYCR